MAEVYRARDTRLDGVNENGAWSPVWSPDSKTVYFHRAAAGQIHGFVLQQQPFQLLNTVDLPVTQFRHQQGYRMYDVLPDGKRFVVIRSGQQGITAATAAATIPPEVKVVLNWFEELKKIAPPQAK